MVNQTKFETFFTAVQDFYEIGGAYLGYAITGGPSGVESPDNAVNPAWRDAAIHMVPFRSWASNTTWDEIASYSKDFTANWMPILRNATPGSGAYASEGDVNEPQFEQSFFGLENYDRLLAIKQKYDPTSLFYTNKGVGSSEWYVTDQLEGLPTQNGKLCRVPS